jgi:hypothetical protein
LEGGFDKGIRRRFLKVFLKLGIFYMEVLKKTFLGDLIEGRDFK